MLVCPDPDLITYWLADEIDEERSWGIRDDAFVLHERLQQLEAPGWFASQTATACLSPHFIAEGGTLTAAQARISRALRDRRGGAARVEQPVRTRGPDALENERAAGVPDPRPGRGAHRGGGSSGRRAATPTPEVLGALAAAEAVIVGPSNPVISIGPILAVPGMREAITPAPGKGGRRRPAGRRPRGRRAPRTHSSPRSAAR